MQFSQLHHSIIYIKICKCLPQAFCASSYRFGYIKKIYFFLQRVGQGHGAQFLLLRYLMAIVKIYKCLPHIFTLAVAVSEIYRFYISDIQKMIKITKYNFRNCTIRWQMPQSTNVFHTFLARSDRFRYIDFLFLTTKKVGQRYGVQYSQLHYSMANVKIYKRNFLHFDFSLCERF